ncbi:MAG: TadE family protein [Terriglobales bacterium]|jgi:Flp pilus assembly protein TadG
MKKMKTKTTKTTKTSLRKILTGSVGSEIAEAALVIPIFFMIMLGIYWFGRAFNTYATINHAAREGARVAVAQTCATCATPNGQPTPDAIATQVKQALQASSLDPSQTTNAGEPLNRIACGGGTTTCKAPGGVGEPQICIYYNVQLQAAASLTAGSGAPACGVSVQFQYPYQFALPYTSLNMQKIMLNAGVQMTGEY